jgi:putative nucleotidyltransferase with HDIG domain
MNVMITSVDRETVAVKVKKLIPEFDLIKDENLRNAAVNVWCDAMDAGGWTPEDLDNIPFTLLLDPCPASFLTHTRSVATVAYKAGETLRSFYNEDKLKINMDYLVCGAILHDVGKLLEYEKSGDKVVKSRNGKFLRHPFSGVGVAFGKGIPDEVLHMIATHAKEGDMGKRIPESVIIHHADFTNFEPFH